REKRVCLGAVKLVHSWNMANPIAIENSVKPKPPIHVSHKAAAPRTIAVMIRVCRLDIETFRRTGLRLTRAFQWFRFSGTTLDCRPLGRRACDFFFEFFNSCPHFNTAESTLPLAKSIIGSVEVR